MTNYVGNSIKEREAVTDKKEVKKIQKVVKQGVKTKKKSELSKIANNIIADEAKSIKEYAVYEVIIPVVKDTITQLIKGSVDMLFYGEVRSSRSSRSGSNASRVSYRDYYDDKRGRDRDRDRRDSRDSRSSRYSYDDIIFDNRQDAEEVLNRMDEIVEQYGVVTVADLFDLVGVTGNGYTDQNYGWTSTRSASVERTRHDKYILKLQRPSNIR